MSKKCYKAEFFQVTSCRFQKSPYLCNVFFIVLDLRLTKVGVQRYSFFFLPNLNISSIKQHNPKEKPLKPLIDKPKIRTFAESIEIT